MSLGELTGSPLTLDEAVAEALAIIEEAKAEFHPVATFALFSGGNDSTALLHLVKNHVDHALHINTGIGIEKTREFVRETCAEWGVSLIEKKTDPSVYRRLVTKYGFPGPYGHRFMYTELKDRQLNANRRDFVKPRSKDCVLYLSGQRAYESQRRFKYVNVPFKREKNIVWANPLLRWDTRVMREYAMKYNLPQNLASALMHKSGECLCGAFSRKGELEELRLWFPETAQYIEHLQHEVVEAAGPHNRFEWGVEAWGGKGKRPLPSPGPLCSGCTFEFNETHTV